MPSVPCTVPDLSWSPLRRGVERRNNRRATGCSDASSEASSESELWLITDGHSSKRGKQQYQSRGVSAKARQPELTLNPNFELMYQT